LDTELDEMSDHFSHLNLHPDLVQAVTKLGYTTPTPIQSAVIPLMLAGQDVIGQAQTGTGKTAAFALPVLHNLAAAQKSVQCLVLAPTRELAIQVAGSFEDYGQYQAIRVAVVYGGQPYGPQIRQLKQGVQVVVGTPGRILDLIRKRVLNLSEVHTLVLDEADEMLSMGFIEDIEMILSETPAGRQTALFSATMPAEIRRLADRYMSDPQSVAIDNKQRTVATIDQRYFLVHEQDKLAALTRIFQLEEITSALIFARTRAGTGALANELTLRGYPAEALNGDMSQDSREQTLSRFQDHRIKVLVATDIAARGLDIEDISHVFNYDMPEFVEVYVHRIGRTGRAGKQGTAISLVAPRELRRLRKIENFIRQPIPPAILPTIDDIQTHRDQKLMDRLLVWLKRNRMLKEKDLVMGLVEAGYDPVDIAAAALKLARVEEKRQPLEPVSDVQVVHAGKSRSIRRSSGRSKANRLSRTSHEEGMVRLMVNAGKIQGVRPQDVVGTIASSADIPGSTIGAILIKDQHTLVDIPIQYVDQVLATTGRTFIRKKAVSIQRA
jgi:ATP-dependent RNA helicase DeaD